MNVLSLFDGHRCGAMALQVAGVPITNYFASEVDPHAIKAANAVYPKGVNIGDVTKVNTSVLPPIDLLIGGSPCQGFSMAGKQLAFDDPRSALFFEYVRILGELRKRNPDVKFLLENVKMKKEYLNAISDILGVQPIFINSNLVSAQNRPRYYWTNIAGVTLPQDRGVALADILEGQDRGLVCAAQRGRYVENGVRKDGKGKAEQRIEVKGDNKTNCLTTVQKDNVRVDPKFFLSQKMLRGFVSRKGAWAGRFKPLTFSSPKAGCLTARYHKRACSDPYFLDPEGIRAFTPQECGRLQTVPEHHIHTMLNCGVSNTQLYRMFGNGWTVEVIAHILRGLE